jgi:hypothetical protein
MTKLKELAIWAVKKSIALRRSEALMRAGHLQRRIGELYQALWKNANGKRWIG